MSMLGNKLGALVPGWQEIQQHVLNFRVSEDCSLGSGAGGQSASLQVTAVTAVMFVFCGPETSFARAVSGGPALGDDAHPLSPAPTLPALRCLTVHPQLGPFLKHVPHKTS